MIFVDTSFFFALASTKDPDHELVREVFEEFDPERLSELWLTTSHVVFESITLARSSLHHRAAVEMGERLYDESMARIHWPRPKRNTRLSSTSRSTTQTVPSGPIRTTSTSGSATPSSPTSRRCTSRPCTSAAAVLRCASGDISSPGATSRCWACPPGAGARSHRTTRRARAPSRL